MNKGDRIYCEKAVRNTLLCYLRRLFLELQEGWKISWNKKGEGKVQNKSKRKQHHTIFSHEIHDIHIQLIDMFIYLFIIQGDPKKRNHMGHMDEGALCIHVVYIIILIRHTL